MDAFGIGAGVKGAVEVYFHSARRSGRTTAMLESLRDGDRVVFLEGQLAEARRIQRLAKELGKTIMVYTVPPHNPRGIFEKGSSEGRTIFDHMWLEAYYRQKIEWAVQEIDHIQREASGFGMAHVETRLAAQEAARWRL